MSKRANGEGSFYFDEKKKIYRAMITTPAGKRLTKSSKDEAVVKDWLNEQRMLVGRGHHIEPHGMTVGKWFKEWLEVYAKPTVRARTYDRYKSLLDHAEPISDVKLNNLMPAHLQKLYNSLSAYSGSTKRKIHYCIRVALQQAVINQLIHTNPATGVKPPVAEKKEIEIFTDEEVSALFKASEDYRYPIIMTIAYTTGMRLSEILALRCQDIDVKKGTISISQTIHKSISQGLILEAPKTKGSKRKITIPPEVSQTIIEHKLKYKISTGLLFLTEKGTPLHPSHYLRFIYDRIREKAGINKNFHALRHTHATMLLSEGMAIADVSRRLGHARISTTLDIYTHSMPSADEKIAKKISEKMSSIIDKNDK